jgi:RNA polymerase sigma-70 factor (ECF subfamily)
VHVNGKVRDVPREGGEIDGFEAFFRVQQPRLVALALTSTADVERARDLAQEALVRAYRGWPMVSSLDQPGAWVRRVLLNLAIDASRRRHHEDDANRRAGVASSVDEGRPNALDEEFWSAVRALPDLQRSVVALHYVDDLAVADVARVLQVSEGSVKTSLHRARATLARTLEVEDD